MAIRLTGKDPAICPVCSKGYMKTYRELPIFSALDTYRRGLDFGNFSFFIIVIN